MQNWLKLIIKLTGAILGAVLMLMLAIVLLVQLPTVQKYFGNKLSAYVYQQSGAKFSVAKVHYVFPGSIYVKGIHLEDTKQDTLLAAKEIAVDFSLLKLWKKQIQISRIGIDSGSSHIYQQASDTAFNFDFLVQAFASSEDQNLEQASDTSQKKEAWQFTLNEIALVNLRFTYDDSNSGVKFGSKIGKFSIKLASTELSEQISIHEIRLANTTLDVQLNHALLKDTTETAPFSIPLDIAKIVVDNSSLNYADHVSGLSFKTGAKAIDILVDQFNLNSQIVHANSVALEEAFFEMSMPSIKETTAIESPTNEPIAESWDIQTNILRIENSRFIYDITDQDYLAEQVDYNHLSLNNIVVSAIGIKIKDDKIQGTLEDLQLKEKSGLQLLHLSGAVDFNSNELAISNLGLQTLGSEISSDIKLSCKDWNDLADSLQQLQADIDLKQVSINAKELSYFLPNLGSNEYINAVSDIRFSGNIKGSTDELAISNFSANNNGQTKLQLSAKVGNLLNAEKTWYQVSLESLISSKSDLFNLIPNLKEQLQPDYDLPKQMELSGQFNGNTDALNFNSLQLKFNTGGKLLADGQITGLQNIEKAHFNISVKKLATGRVELLSLMSNSVRPPGLHIPENLSIAGKFIGTSSKFDLNSSLTTNLGVLSAQVQFEQEHEQSEAKYSGTLSTKALDVGALIDKEEMLGKLSLELGFNGVGLADSTLKVDLNGQISTIEFNAATYSDISIAGVFEKDLFNGQVAISDTNLQLSLDGFISIKDSLPHSKFKLDVKRADLHAMNLLEDSIVVNANFEGDISGNNLSNVNGFLAVREATITKGSQLYHIDSIRVGAKNDSLQSAFDLESNLFTASMSGNIHLQDYDNAFMQHVKRYFSIQKNTWQSNQRHQKFEFEFELKEPKQIVGLFDSEIEDILPSKGSGSYDSYNYQFDLDLDLPGLRYAGAYIDSIRVQVQSDSLAINYSIEAGDISHSSYTIGHSLLQGKVYNDTLLTTLELLDSSKAIQYRISSFIESTKNGIAFSLPEDGIILNYAPWDVNPENQLLVHEGKLVEGSLMLSDDDHMIRLQTLPARRSKTPLSIDFLNFKLPSVLKAFSAHEDGFDGYLNGNIQFNDLTQAELFDADFVLSDFSFNNDTLGNIHIVTATEMDGSLTFSADINGKNNEASIEGWYDKSVQKSLFIDFELQQLQLHTIEAYVANYLPGLQGDLSGRLVLAGRPEDFSLEGNARIRKTSFKVQYLNSQLYLEDETLRFQNKQLHFNNFVLLDTLNNRLKVDGYISAQNFSKPAFFLDVHSDNFLALNTKQKHNDLYFGKVFLNSDTKIRGNLEKPNITVNAKVLKNSKITYIMPDAQGNIEDKQGVVEFVVLNDSLEIFTNDNNTNDSIISELTGMNITVNLEVDKEFQLHIVVDPLSKDSLKVRGEGIFSLNINPTGEVNLSGTYEIEEGTYQVVYYNLMKRKFDIIKGSRITWSGDPLEAAFDIKAVYTVKASPVDLVAAEVANKDLLDAYNKKLPFLLQLNMQGTLSKPQLKFSIELPAEHKNVMGGIVQRRLSQLNTSESELNKQVFSLLTFNRFTTPSRKSGIDISSQAGNSISSILTNQLNKISEKYVTFVDLDINVESTDPNSAGVGISKVDLELSRQLFGDRILVQVGSSVDLGGNQSSTSNLIGSFVIEYKLTADNTYKIVAYRKNDDEFELEEEVTQTGVGIVYTKEFDRFAELLKRMNKDKKPESDNP